MKRCWISSFIQQPRWKWNFGGSLTDDEVIDSLIDDVIMEETRFHPLVGEVMNERSVSSVKEVTEKKWQSIVAPLDINYGREQILPDYEYDKNL